MSMGAAHNNSSDAVTQGAIGYSAIEGVTSDMTTTTVNDACLSYVWNGGESLALVAGTFDSSGFTLTPNGATSPDSRHIFYLALDTGDEDAVSIDTETSPTSTGYWCYNSKLPF